MRDTADSFTSFERTYVMIGLGSLFLPVFSDTIWWRIGPAPAAAVGAGRLGSIFIWRHFLQ